MLMKIVHRVESYRRMVSAVTNLIERSTDSAIMGTHKERDGKDEPIEPHLVRPLAALGVFFRVAPEFYPSDSAGAHHYNQQ